MSDVKQDAFLELNQKRTITLVDRDKTYKLICRRIQPYDWEKYFSGIVVTVQQQGNERINGGNITLQLLALAESVLIDAQGYKVAGAASLTDIPNWQLRIPLAHRLRLADALTEVRPSEDDGEFIIQAEGEVVHLDALWSYVESPHPGMQCFKGLKHILRTPTEAQHRRYRDEASRSRVVGGSRSAKTYYRSAQLLLTKLYDELVISVEGYSIDGQPLTDTAAIIREMDMLHKFAAAQELFQPQSVAQLADPENEQ